MEEPALPEIPTAPILDPWDFLGVARDTPLDDIKRQRNTLALATHPDKCPSPSLRPEWTTRMARVNEAFTLATDDAAWSKYKQDHRIRDPEDDLADLAAASAASASHQDSARVANAKAHAATNTNGAAARAARDRNLQARADAVEASLADGTCTPAARDRWDSYLSGQRAGNAEDPAARVAAREGRDAARAREDAAQGARAAVGLAAGAWDDAAALLVGHGGSWTEEELAGESLGAAEEAEGGSHKRRKAARRMLVGEAVERRDRARVAWEEEHGGGSGAGGGGGAVLGAGAERLRIGRGEAAEADEEMEMVEEERRRRARKLEQYAETNKFQSEWTGMFGNETVVRKPPRPPNRKEARQMKKLGISK